MSDATATTLVHVSDLVQTTLDQIDDPSVSTSTVARRALRIARLRNDWEAQWWLQLETTTPEAGGTNLERLTGHARRLAGEAAAHLNRLEFQQVENRVIQRWLSSRNIDKNISVHSIAALEELVAGVEAQIASLAPIPAGMRPADLQQVHRQVTQASAQLRAAATEMNQILARIRTQIGDYLSATETQLLLGQVNADIFERNRKWVDERLARDAPEVLDQFASAYRRQADGDGESRSHALTSCRRVLKTLADALYPPDNAVVEGIDGRARKMTDDKPISRLIQFASDNANGTGSRSVLVAQINALGERLTALTALSSKGVHAQVSDAEVDQCLIQTYLAVGDLLRLADAVADVSAQAAPPI